MNRYLEVACGWFGARSCESASSSEIFVMVFAVAFAGIFAAWLIGKISANATS